MQIEGQKWFIMLAALGIVLIILGAICQASGGKADSTSQNNVKNSGCGVWVIGLIITCLAAFLMYKEYAKNNTFQLYYY